MQILDLGRIDTPVLLFGGPYSNLQALNSLFAAAKSANISENAMICTGDMVAYGADGDAVVTEILRRNIPVVAGNCEKQLASGALDCGCGFEQGSTCSILSRGWYAHALNTISTSNRIAMANCPDTVVFSHFGQRYAVIHGGVTDISRFLWSVSPDSEFIQEINALTKEVNAIDTIISGHSGIAFDRKIGKTRWINAGVIGMPENDGSPDTKYLILRNGIPEFHRLTYDFETAAQAMEQVGLTQGYQNALRTGFWPSEDVLPVSLRRFSRVLQSSSP